jgi:hypothetical protein
MKEQIRNDVEMLAIAGGRAVGTKGHDTARQYLDQRLRQLQLQPYTGDSFQMPYGVDRVSFVNLVGRLPGQSTDTNPLLIGAHYDTCGPTPGADDNAAAVAIVLAAAKRLKESPLERDVIVAIFDKIEAIANSLVDIVRRCDAAQFSPAGRAYDSTPTELLFMKRSLGPFLEARGMAPLQSRADLDKIASLLLSQFRL